MLVSVPYTIKEETKQIPGVNKAIKNPGHFYKTSVFFSPKPS